MFLLLVIIAWKLAIGEFGKSLPLILSNQQTFSPELINKLSIFSLSRIFFSLFIFLFELSPAIEVLIL